LILYEYPFNESIRTMLRLEHLFDRLGQLIERDAAVDHHHALATIFEIMDVGSRADLKSDLLKELEKHRQQLVGYRGNPSIAEAVLDDVIGRIDGAHARLNQVSGKAGAALTTNEWLMSIRSRISIPGGTCEFDLPAYYAWQQQQPSRRRADLLQWVASLMPLAEALQVLLGYRRAVLAEPGGRPSISAHARTAQRRGRARSGNQRPPPHGASAPDAPGARRTAAPELRRHELRADPLRLRKRPWQNDAPPTSLDASCAAPAAVATASTP
jgi:cell division protein ZapD